MPSQLVEKSGFSFQRMLERQFLPVIFTAALAGSFSAHYFVHGHDGLRDSLAAICDAIFIAAFLAFAVDPVLKQGLLKESSRSIFRYLYGYSLPPALQKFYDTTVLGTQDLRTTCKLHWRIRPVASDADRVEVRLHCSFGMDNFTHDAHLYTHEVFAVSDTPRAKGCVESLYCYDNEENAYCYEITSAQLAQLPDLKKLNHTQRGRKAGPPIELAAKSGVGDHTPRYRFGAHYYSEQSWPHGLDWFRITEVTTEVEVTISVDEKLKDHYFTIIPSPSSGLDGKAPAFDLATQTYMCRWEFKRLFVPNETLIFRWQPPEPTLPKANPAAAPQPA